ncbi:MAG TPA: thioredoxin family protein [Dongiaceae bacterium]|nr:thioredoxin family protein [Dongiaceae bacterium]
MNTRSLPVLFLIALLATSIILPAPVRAEDALKKARPDIYDESADAAQQVATALTQAGQEHKHVLLQFGANWCIWCHRLHELCASNPEIAAFVKTNYVVVLVNVNQGRNQATDDKYGNPTHLGLPALVVLDATGKQLATQDSGKLEEGDHHSPAKVLAFLKKWAPQH